MRARALERLTIAARGVTEVDLFFGAAGLVWAGCLIAEVTGDPFPWRAGIGNLIGASLYFVTGR